MTVFVKVSIIDFNNCCVTFKKSVNHRFEEPEVVKRPTRPKPATTKFIAPSAKQLLQQSNLSETASPSVVLSLSPIYWHPSTSGSMPRNSAYGAMNFQPEDLI